jgi:hypothetical protein
MEIFPNRTPSYASACPETARARTCLALACCCIALADTSCMALAWLLHDSCGSCLALAGSCVALADTDNSRTVSP